MVDEVDDNIRQLKEQKADKLENLGFYKNMLDSAIASVGEGKAASTKGESRGKTRSQKPG